MRVDVDGQRDNHGLSLHLASQHTNFCISSEHLVEDGNSSCPVCQLPLSISMVASHYHDHWIRHRYEFSTDSIVHAMSRDQTTTHTCYLDEKRFCDPSKSVGLTGVLYAFRFTSFSGVKWIQILIRHDHPVSVYECFSRMRLVGRARYAARDYKQILKNEHEAWQL